MSQYYIGLLSGTSVDSCDAAIWSFENQSAQRIYSHAATIGPQIKKHILELASGAPCTIQEVGRLDSALGHLFANAVNELLLKANINRNQIAAIGSHGQTLWHEPQGPYPFSMQLGCPNIIAQQTHCLTVADFRRADLALGGQGAPLVPSFHHHLFQSDTEHRIIVNIGGIANLSILPKSSDKPLAGYDTGPGNALMDAWCEQHTGQPYDKDGQFAQSGQRIKPLLAKMLQTPYFKQPFPKSTGRETFHLKWLSSFLKGNEKPQDVQATLLALTCQSIATAIKGHFDKASVYVCGGGVHNHALLSQLNEILGSNYSLESLEALGVHPDWVESALFAWMAKQRIEGKVIALKEITGSSHDTLLGGVYLPHDYAFEKATHLSQAQTLK